MQNSALLTAYQTEVDAGRLQADEAQARAIRALDSLFLTLSQREREGGRIQKYLYQFLSPHPSRLGRATLSHKRRGVYLHGPVGRGKTAMMDLFFRTLPDTVPKRRVHFHEFMLSVQAFLHDLRRAGTHGVDDALPKFAAHVAQSARVLCFDEFQVRDVADAMILSRLFTALFAAGVTVVMTSNVAPDDLYAGGLQRDLFLPFIDLIKSRLDVVLVAGPHDYRVDRVAGRPVYFSPLGAAADHHMDQMFYDLTDVRGQDAGPDRLDVLGHVVDIPFAAHGVARGTFAHFCERPLAAQDYIALADRYHTVMVDHVPRLTYDRRNETKRFIILVDILYERHRRLVLSADAPMDRLFVDNEHAFEFARTLSRLQEMASVGWGKE